jgi:hypothetical protein
MTRSVSRVLVATTALLAAGCATTSAGHPSNGHVTSVAPAQATHVSTPADVAQRLLDGARVPPGAVLSAKPPIRSMASPPEGLVVDGLVVKHRWWRINLPLAAAYAWVAHHQSADLSSIGSSSSGGPQLTDIEHDADFAPPQLPKTVNSAHLSMEVAPLTAQISAIGAYAVVVRQPVRQQIEDVPATVDSVTVLTRKTSGEPDAGQLLGRRVLTGAAAQKITRDFDALSVQPPGEQFSCPLSFITQTAMFRAGDHTWTATSGVCIGVGVSLDGHRLATLDGSNAFSRDLRAAYGHRFPRLGNPQPMTHANLAPSTVTS